ncbi:hypothetical protein [Thiocapsa marina]|uniref:PBP domain-containing protein n=1 Tax=Thiocapsa marina 5811 TaxID=768671 RepID=F9U8A9_9GAMM|nr:hypothetical protein [Thiocapsa marina]EGV19521.1 hypothetical protein ThimaDRAFT_0967 [Thiocapsa marina 5811]
MALAVRRSLRFHGFSLACFACALWPTCLTGQETIVNQSLAPRELTQNEARLYFGMRRRLWADGQPVKIYVLPDDHPLHIAFAKDLLGLFPSQLRTGWDRQIFSGTGQAPTTVANEEEMIRRVASTPGAIGYVSKLPKDPRVRMLEVR